MPAESAAKITLRPDGFFQLQKLDSAGTPLESTFFLELDRSTEVLETLVTRAQCYRHYYHTGGLADRAILPRSEFRRFPFRVLIVLRNPERRNNLAERLLLTRPAILWQTWLTTYAEAISNPLGQIWTRPQDYREVISGSTFARPVFPSHLYRRDSLREQFVEERLKKLPLLTHDRRIAPDSRSCGPI
jgi:hypothetical protein